MCLRSSSRRADAAMRGCAIILSTCATGGLQLFCCEACNMALMRSMWICVSLAPCAIGLFAFFGLLAAMLLSKFLRSSNIRNDVHSVSSIFSDWLVTKAEFCKGVAGASMLLNGFLSAVLVSRPADDP